MTSVQSHHRLLNGNSILLLSLSCFIFFSCGTGKKAKKTTLPPPISYKVDTITWKEDTYGAPPISSEGIVYDEDAKEDPQTDVKDETRPSSDKLGSYKISCLFPFYASQFSPSNAKSKEKSQRAISLYSGMKMATDLLGRENINLTISVHDSNGSEQSVKSILEKPELQMADLVIGPFKKGNVSLSAEHCKKKKIPFVSPMNPSADMASGNPYFVQLKPSLEAHCQAITNHVLSRFSPEEVVLVCRNKSAEMSRLAYFNEAKAEFTEGADASKFKEYVVSDYGNNFTNMDFMGYFPMPDIESGVLPEKVTRVFIIPSWSSETFINSALRLIRIAKQHHDVYVYGMPRWKTYSKVDFEYYESLNLHLSSDGFIDLNTDKAKQFRQQYFYKYGELPTDDAFYGYDMMLYFGRMIDKHGTQFQTSIDDEPFEGIHSSFEFIPVNDSGNIEKPSNQYLGNQHVDIIKFENFYFQEAN